MFTVKQVAARKVAGFRWVGPWDETVAQGFEQLASWTHTPRLQGEWLAIYYDDPDVVPAEQLRCDTVIAVADDFVLPAGSEEVSLMTIPSGLYAIGQASIENEAFFDAWKICLIKLSMMVVINSRVNPVMSATSMMVVSPASGR